MGGLGSPAPHITVPSNKMLNIPKFDEGQLISIFSIKMPEPILFEIVHSATVLLVLKLPMLIKGQRSSVGVLLGLVVAVGEEVCVTVGVLVEVGGTVAVAVFVALGIIVEVREAVGVIDGVTPGSSVAVREGVAVRLGTSVLVAPLVAAAVLVAMEMAVAV